MAESGFILLVMNRKQKFGQLIAEARARADVYGKDLAPKLGISASTLSNLETGNFTYPPDPEILDAIERELGVTKNRLGIALGYYEEADADAEPWDAKMPPIIREALADIDWEQPTAITQALVMLNLIRDAQRSGNPPRLHDPSEVDRKP